MEYLPFIVFGGFVVLAIFIGLYSIQSERKRVGKWRIAADELGFQFQPTSNAELLEGLGKLPLFNQGRSRKRYNVITGDNGGLKVGLFDYKYTTGSGKSSTTHTLSVVWFHCAEMDLPEFALRPESFVDRFVQWFTGPDINFEDYPMFSRLYHLKGPTELAVRELFHSGILEYFEKHPGLYVEGRRQHLVVYRADVDIDPHKAREALEEAYPIYNLMRDSLKTA